MPETTSLKQYGAFFHFILTAVFMGSALLMPVYAADLSLRLLPTAHKANSDSPFASAEHALLRAETLLNWQQAGWTFNGALSGQTDNQQQQTADAHLNELFYDTSLGDWELSLGQKRLGWGLGFGFRPLDTVQREPRRTVQPVLLDGVPAVMLEKFTQDSSLSLIYALQTQWYDWHTEETAHSTTARWYHFRDAWEFMGLGAWEEQRGATLGGGFSWVQGDNWKYYGELAWRQNYAYWRSHLLDSGELLYSANPMYQEQRHNAWQTLLGVQWTHAGGMGILVEYWYDGSAWRANEWADLFALTRRQQAAALDPAIPSSALNANLAAAEQAYLAPNHLRHNLLLRLSHDSGERSIAMEYLLTPEADGGALTLVLEDNSLDRQKIRFGMRRYGGPKDSAYGALADAFLIFASWEMGWRL